MYLTKLEVDLTAHVNERVTRVSLSQGHGTAWVLLLSLELTLWSTSACICATALRHPPVLQVRFCGRWSSSVHVHDDVAQLEECLGGKRFGEEVSQIVSRIDVLYL